MLWQRIWPRKLLILTIFILATLMVGLYVRSPRQLARTRPPLPSSWPITALVPVTVASRPLVRANHSCSEQFLAHELDHLTNTADGIIRAFDANGAGVAIGDLDNDDDLDIVLGAQAGPNTLLWNEGALHFTKTTFGEGPTRAVTIVDVDADGLRDIVVTTNRGLLHYWHNDGRNSRAPTLTRQVLAGIAYPAYAINWGDLDMDGDLDLVTASYDAGFLTDIGTEYLLGDSAGVYVYEQAAARFRPTRLAANAQALALALWDIDHNGLLDIVVGNDFAVPDYVWLQSDGRWQSAAPFAVTAYSTMSLDQGDINNDGVTELLAADMNPYDSSPARLAQWLPVINAMAEGARLRDDPQTMTNAMQQWRNGVWQEVATEYGIQATGWSWTSRFGDLDNDGFLDLYVVNGMIEAGTFAHLPSHELIEENQSYRNDGQGNFVAMPGWGLNSLRSGRSMVMADMDADGDLDIIVNNLRSAAQLMENRHCLGNSLAVQLAFPDAQNLDAIGSRLLLVTSAGILTRDVRAASGYLSGDAPLIHFGFPTDTVLFGLYIRWPDGAASKLTSLVPNTHLHITRTQ